MVDIRTALATLLTLISLAFTAVMEAGTSKDCGVVASLPWAGMDRPAYLDSYSNSHIEIFLGVKTSCLMLDGKHVVSLESDSKEFTFGDYSESELWKSCHDCGDVVLYATHGAFTVTFVLVGIGAARLCNHSLSGGVLKAASILMACIGILCLIVALSHFDSDCLNEMDGYPLLAMILGSITTFLLAVVSVLHVTSSAPEIVYDA